MRTIVLVLAALSLHGCTSSFTARIDPAVGAFDGSRRDEAWDRARAELEKRGFRLKTAERAQGLLRTEKLRQPGHVPCGLVSCWYRDEVEIVVAPAGAATVRVERETAMPCLIPAFADWYPVASTQKSTIETVVAYQRELLRAITPLDPDPQRAASPTPAPAASPVGSTL
jgi:hypothetical protein